MRLLSDFFHDAVFSLSWSHISGGKCMVIQDSGLVVHRFLWEFLARDNLGQILFSFVVDSVQGSFQLLSSLFSILLGLLAKPVVQFPPVLRVFGLMLLFLPIRNITFDELQPNLAIPSNDLWGVSLKLTLKCNC
jgi:hypothetical protein